MLPHTTIADAIWDTSGPWADRRFLLNHSTHTQSRTPLKCLKLLIDTGCIVNSMPLPSTTRRSYWCNGSFVAVKVKVEACHSAC